MSAEKLSLTDLQLIIRDSLYISLPDFYWVTAEIAEIKENYSGHCYLELIEKNNNDKNVKARAKAIIWGNRYRFLKSFFENATGEPIKEGMRILVKVKIEYHEVYGLSLVISDIDPAFTIGEMALKRLQIIKKLEDEGVFSMNKEIQFPVLPQRIAIISSKNAAGFADFINQLRENKHGYAFFPVLFESAMQGTETEQAVISALEQIAENCDLFDVVAIIRGGGSLTDLSWFDNYNIAYYITQFPLPVITGIGHEKDLSVTDMVANTSLKTPTAVADFLIDCMAEAEGHLENLGSSIVESSLLILENFKNRTDNARMNLKPHATMFLAQHREKLSTSIIDIINIGKEYVIRAGISPEKFKSRLLSGVNSYALRRNSDINRMRENLKNSAVKALTNKQQLVTGFNKNLEMLNPENVLKRGYTITTVNGRIIKSSKGITDGTLINTRFTDGEVKSEVLTNNSKKLNN